MNLLILRIITFLVENIENQEIVSKFTTLINKARSYYSNPLQKVSNKVEDIYQWLNPLTYVNLIKKGHQKQIQQILNQLEKENNFKNKQQFKNENYINTSWQFLNSSWLDSGMFNITNKLTLIGNLTLLIYTKKAKNPKWYGPYVYTGVPVEVWKILSSAVSNAGTLFWKYWLRKWLPSHLRKYIKSQLPRELKEKYPKGSTKLTIETNKKLNKIKNFIYDLQKGHFNFNFQGEINNKSWYQERRNIVKNIKSFYIKPVNNFFYQTNKTVQNVKKVQRKFNYYKPVNFKNRYKTKIRGVLHGK